MVQQLSVTATLHQARVLYEIHIGPMPADMPYQDALTRLVSKLGIEAVQGMVAKTPAGATLSMIACPHCGSLEDDPLICGACGRNLDRDDAYAADTLCYYCGKPAYKRMDVARGVDTYICRACDTDPAKPCGCIDRSCPAHPNVVCAMPATTTIYRVDMDDDDGTHMCDDCAADAIESGLFTTIKPVNVESCWGCGPDWRQVAGSELTDITIYGMAEKVCPACYDELPEDYET